MHHELSSQDVFTVAPKGLKCPECGLGFSTDPSMIHGGYTIGETCGNQNMKGTDPSKCSPEYPCKGKLVPA